MTPHPIVDESFLQALDAVPLTPTDSAGYSEAEWGVLVAYLHGEGTGAERQMIAHWLAHDPAFAAAAASIQPFWQTPLPSVRIDVDAGLQRLRAAAAVLPVASGEDPTVQDPAGQGAAVPDDSAVDPPARGAERVGHVQPLRASRRRRFRPPRSLTRLTAIAATLVVGVFGAHLLHNHFAPAYHYRGGATGRTAVLPDDTQVTLAPGSYLGTARSFPHGTRSVYLYGGAHFSVAPNPRIPFVVHTFGVSTRVLGTRFSIQADTTVGWHVQVEQGKVALAVRGSDGHWRTLRTLTAGEAVHLPLVAAWIAQVGYDLAGSGVSLWEQQRIIAALRRAVIRLGTEATRESAGRP